MSIVAETGAAFNGVTEALALTSRDFDGALRVHSVTTTNRDLAFALFSEAQEFDNEPVFDYLKRGVYGVAFLSTDGERDTIINLAGGVA